MTTIVSGWIPNVTGRLSLTLIGMTDQAGKCERTDHPSGALAVTQVRDSADAIYKKLQFGRNVICHLLVKKETVGTREVLRGYATLAPNCDGVGKQFRTWFLDQNWDNPSIKDFVANVDRYIDLDVIHCGNSVRVFRIDIWRDGIVELTAAGAWLLKSFDADELTPLQSARQVFIFVKDISHKHQHHSHSSDQLTRAHEGAWANNAEEIQKDLMRAALSARRQASKRSLGVSAGILTYARAFLEILRRRGIATPQVLWEANDIDRLDRSIAVRVDQLHADGQNTWGALAVWLAMFAGVLAASAATMSMYVDDQKKVLFAKLHPVAIWITERIFFTSSSTSDYVWATITWSIFGGAMLMCFPSCRRVVAAFLNLTRLVATRLATTGRTRWALGPVVLIVVSTVLLVVALLVLISLYPPKI